MNTFQIPRPQPPVQLFLLAALDAAGFVALWLAAYHAFSQVAGPWQAFFAATLIEAGMVIEALALIKRPGVWYIWLGVVLSLVVSAGYNYIQAAAAVTVDGVVTLNPFLLFTLALGPLSALCFVSLTLGYELREHQERMEKWTTDRANWFEARRVESEQRQAQLDLELQARLERIQLAERERQEREAERRFQAEKEERDFQHKQIERAQSLAQRKKRLAELALQPEPLAVELDPPAIEPALKLAVQLKCDRCGAIAGKNGLPFRSQAALNAHRPFCPGSIASTEPNPEPAVITTNGSVH